MSGMEPRFSGIVMIVPGLLSTKVTFYLLWYRVIDAIFFCNDGRSILLSSVLKMCRKILFPFCVETPQVRGVTGP